VFSELEELAREAADALAMLSARKAPAIPVDAAAQAGTK